MVSHQKSSRLGGCIQIHADRFFSILNFLIFPVIFLSLVVVQFGVVTWLLLYPGLYVRQMLSLYDVSDMDYKMLLVAVAALNFLICFVVEVSDRIQLS